MQVHRRLVIYVQGYDPRGLPEYYRMFRREFRRTCELYGLTGKVGRIVEGTEPFTAFWDVNTSGAEWSVDTRYLFLRWDDIIRRDLMRPPWWKIAHMYRVMLIALLNGVVVRIARAHWRFGLFILYPVALMTAWAGLGVAAGLAAMNAIAALGVPVPAAGFAGAIIGIGVFSAILWFTESQTYLLYLCDDVVATHQFVRRQRPDWDARIEQFAAVVNAVRNSNADEVIIVGHSSGSFLAVDVLARALDRDPDLGRRGPKLRLLTVGANFPIVGFQPAARWFRDQIRLLAREPAIDWVDFQSRHDIMNFWPFDPVAGHGIEAGPGRRNPVVVAVSFRDLWRAEGFNRRRWRFFKAHFQFLLANERAGAAYDYYLICCGPFDLMTWATKPAEIAAAMAKRPSAVELPGTAKLV